MNNHRRETSRPIAQGLTEWIGTRMFVVRYAVCLDDVHTAADLLPVRIFLPATNTSGTRATATATPSALLTAGCKIDYLPFCMVKSDVQATGFEVEVLQAAPHAVGRKVVLETGTRSENKSRLESGSLHVLLLVGRTPEREAAFDFTSPYLNLHRAITFIKGTTGILTLAALKSRSVAVTKGDNAAAFPEVE